VVVSSSYLEANMRKTPPQRVEHKMVVMATLVA